MSKVRRLGWLNCLIILGSLVIIGSLILIYFFPAPRLAQARNAKRWTAVQQLLATTVNYWQSHEQQLPVGITAEAKLIGQGSNCQLNCFSAGKTLADCLDLSVLIDPDNTKWNKERTGYAINFIAGRLKVFSCGAELEEEISLSQQLIE